MTQHTELADYAALKATIHEAGFFTTYGGCSDENDQPLDIVRLIVASESLGSAGVSGKSFWVLKINSRWFLGTWVTLAYEVAEDRITPLCIAWMNRLLLPSPEYKSGTTVDADLQKEFEAVLLTDDELDGLIQ